MQLAAARAHIVARQWDRADVELSAALETAPYIMDSSWAYVWRGVLEYERGHQQLARLSFRRALALYPDPGVRGLDSISPEMASLFDAESRAMRTYRAWDLDQPVRWLTAPQFVYPREPRVPRISGPALVRVIVDTLGRVSDRNVEILEIPDPAFAAPLKEMMMQLAFSPARIGGKPVRSLLSYQVRIAPPPAQDPLRLIAVARTQIRAGQADSALTLLEQALNPANGATPAVRMYAELVEGIAWQTVHDTAQAARCFSLGLDHYQRLTAQGVDFAPFLRRLVDSVRSASRN